MVEADFSVKLEPQAEQSRVCMREGGGKNLGPHLYFLPVLGVLLGS